MLTATQKKTAQAIVNIFETSAVLGDYGKVTLIEGDTGRLTFGRSQTTLGSGNLHKLLGAYCENAGARFASRLRPLLPRFAAKQASLDTDWKVHNLLRATADDPVMRETQDIFFDEHYWKTAERIAAKATIVTPLGVAVVYDSVVHGSWPAIRNLTNNKHGAIEKLGEEAWIKKYVERRLDWLANHKRADLRACRYRMDTLLALIDQGYWGLELPLVIRGHEISTASLTATPTGCYDGPQLGSRTLSVQSPLQRGLDVRLIQLALSDAKIQLIADGVFGRTSSECVKQFQKKKKLPQTGVVDSEVIGAVMKG